MTKKKLSTFKKPNEVDLWNEILPMLDSGDLDRINGLTTEQINMISPFMCLKAMSGVKSRYAVVALLSVNTIVNRGFWTFTKHPKLQLMLLSLCNPEPSKHYFPGARKKNPVFDQIQIWYPTWKEDEVKMLIDISSKDELLRMGLDHGMQDKEYKEWKKNVSK